MNMGRKKKTVSEEVDAGMKAEQAAADQEYPYLKTPAEQGAVIIGTDERESTRPMTETDVKEAHDTLYTTSQKLRTAAQKEKDLGTEVKRLEALLKGTREELREAEVEQLILGRKLATLSEEIHTGVRKIDIKVVESVTKGNEFVVTDARSGVVIERRTATQDEIEESRSPQKGQTGMFGSTQAADDIVLVSLHTARYEKTKRGIKDGLLAVPYPNSEGDPDGDTLGIVWELADKRSIAKVPRWAADRLKKIADGDKALDFKIGDLAALAEKLSTDADGVTMTVQ
jgi:hypothetical protein